MGISFFKQVSLCVKILDVTFVLQNALFSPIRKLLLLSFVTLSLGVANKFVTLYFANNIAHRLKCSVIERPAQTGYNTVYRDQ